MWWRCEAAATSPAQYLARLNVSLSMPSRSIRDHNSEPRPSFDEEVNVTEHTPHIDFENLPAPSEGFLVTLFITVRSVARSRAFYSEVLGGQVVLEENPCMVKVSNSWVIMNPGGGPTPDKPGISVVNYEFDNTISAFMNLRVAETLPRPVSLAAHVS
jgi:hypothetical protein